MIKTIDSHIHFWDLDNGYNDWVKNTDLPRVITPDMTKSEAYVHIEAHSEEQNPLCEYNWLKEKFNNYNINVVAFVDFTADISKFEKDVLNFKTYKNIVGVRQIMSKTTKSKYSPFKKNIPQDFLEKLNILKENDLIFEAQMYPEQFLSILDDIVYSGVKMAIEHLAMPIFCDKKSRELWSNLIKEICKNERWYLKVSGFDINNNMAEIDRCLDYVFSHMSIDNLCYGSNYPVTSSNNYKYWSSILISFLNEKSNIEKVFFSNSNKIYFRGELHNNHIP